MADKTMPPSDPTEKPEMPGVMGATSPDAGGDGGGDVMINMPKSAFDALHQMVQQLASGLEQLAQSVNGKEGGGDAGAAAATPPSPADGAPMAKPAAKSAKDMTDEEFLQNMVNKSNAR